ncbi:MAG: alpha/beta fold hydrolase [Cyclobacteriaceae bacterium]
MNLDSTIQYSEAATKYGSVRYMVIGPKNGEIVLFSSGGAVGYNSVLGFEWLAKKGFRLICINRPGYYDLPIDTTTELSGHVDIYQKVLLSIGVKQPVHVFGVSMGGLFALYYAEKYPTKSLVVWCGVSGKYVINEESANSTIGKLVLSKNGKKLVSSLLKFSAKFFPKSSIEIFLKASANLDKKQRKAIAKQVVNNPESKKEFLLFVESMTPMDAVYEGTMDEAYKAAELEDVDWSTIECPTFAVYSTVDIDVTLDHAERLEKMIPNIQMKYVVAGVHYVWWGNEGEEVKQATTDFLLSLADD